MPAAGRAAWPGARRGARHRRRHGRYPPATPQVVGEERDKHFPLATRARPDDGRTPPAGGDGATASTRRARTRTRTEDLLRCLTNDRLVGWLAS